MISGKTTEGISMKLLKASGKIMRDHRLTYGSSLHYLKYELTGWWVRSFSEDTGDGEWWGVGGDTWTVSIEFSFNSNAPNWTSNNPILLSTESGGISTAVAGIWKRTLIIVLSN